MFWAILISFIISYVAMSKAQAAPTPAVGEIKAPTAEDGVEIPVLFGTKDVTGPNVVYFGDIKTRPHKKSGGKK
jgi:hypothetical protein